MGEEGLGLFAEVDTYVTPNLDKQKLMDKSLAFSLPIVRLVTSSHLVPEARLWFACCCPPLFSPLYSLPLVLYFPCDLFFETFSFDTVPGNQKQIQIILILCFKDDKN